MFCCSTVSMSEHITINGERLTVSALPSWSKGRCGIAAELADFLKLWYSESPVIPLQTSGSTGTPTLLPGNKISMKASARLSCEIFGINEHSRVLLCLPLRYIAGKMMVVRALVSGANLLLREPSSTPLAELTEDVDFAPLVPMQAASTLRQPDGVAQLARARCILLGGGFIDPTLTRELQQVPSRIYASYGMTETYSHIALRRVNGAERSDWYTPLPGVQIKLGPQGTLSLSAPHLGIQELITNDLAECDGNGNFRILGRIDSVINSGGVKLQAEQIEQELTAATGLNLLLLPQPDPILGQCAVLVWEGPSTARQRLLSAIAELPTYHRPRLIHHIPELPRTATGKLNRAAAGALLTHTQTADPTPCQ